MSFIITEELVKDIEKGIEKELKSRWPGMWYSLWFEILASGSDLVGNVVLVEDTTIKVMRQVRELVRDVLISRFPPGKLSGNWSCSFTVNGKSIYVISSDVPREYE